jgi:hypothetical protein
MFAILAALLGAAVASWAAHILAVRRENERTRVDRRRDAERERRERQREADREHRELVGLLKLVHVEVVNNLEVLKGMGARVGTSMRSTDSLQAPKLSIEAWDQSRTRIAALLKDEERLKHLVGGYAALQAFKDRLLHPDTNSLTDQEHEVEVKKIRSHQWLSFDACQKETGMFWGRSKGMLVSQPAKDLSEAEATIEQP